MSQKTTTIRFQHLRSCKITQATIHDALDEVHVGVKSCDVTFEGIHNHHGSNLRLTLQLNLLDQEIQQCCHMVSSASQDTISCRLKELLKNAELKIRETPQLAAN